jgi:predicted Rossmann-fold nucleotide-binding protein
MQSLAGILNALGFYSPLLGLLDPAVGERFLKPENRELVRARVTPAGLLPAPEDWRPSHVDKWLSRERR